MKNHYVITINRQFGSGGRLIGERLAEKLEIEYLDRKILAECAQKMGFAEEHLKGFEEKAPSIWTTPTVEMGAFSAVGIPYYLYSSTNDDLYIAQTKLIEEKAKEGSCVVLGRCANSILKDDPKCISIFLYANLDFKREIISKEYKMEMKNAEKEIKRVDKERFRYYENYTGQRWDDIAQYDLAINTATLGIDNTVDLIINYIKAKFKEV